MEGREYEKTYALFVEVARLGPSLKFESHHQVGDPVVYLFLIITGALASGGRPVSV